MAKRRPFPPSHLASPPPKQHRSPCQATPVSVLMAHCQWPTTHLPDQLLQLLPRGHVQQPAGGRARRRERHRRHGRCRRCSRRFSGCCFGLRPGLLLRLQGRSATLGASSGQVMHAPIWLSPAAYLHEPILTEHACRHTLPVPDAPTPALQPQCTMDAAPQRACRSACLQVNNPPAVVVPRVARHQAAAAALRQQQAERTAVVRAWPRSGPASPSHKHREPRHQASMHAAPTAGRVRLPASQPGWDPPPAR